MVDICIKLAEQYSSSFSHPDSKFKIENPKQFFCTNEENTGPKLCDIDFMQKSIIEAIEEVKNNAAPSTDHFPAILLKSVQMSTVSPVYILWSYLLDNGDIAPMIKTAVMCPILKPGS